MNPLFEKNIKERLNSFSSVPPPQSKDKIFAQLRSNRRRTSRRRIIGVLLFLIAIQFWIPKNTISEEKLDDSPNETMSKSMADLPNESHSCNNIDNSLMSLDNTLMNQNQLNPVPANSITQDNPTKILTSKVIQNRAKRGLYPIINESEENQEVIPPTPVDTEKKVDEKRLSPSFNTFFNVGIMFLYNKFNPNFGDDLIIENFKGMSRLSPSRLGLSMRYGIKRKVSNKVSLFGAGSFTYYRVNYEFDVRENTTSNSDVRIEGNRIILNPHFISESIKVNHSQFASGIEFGSEFFVFPSQANSFSLSLVYNYVYVRNHSFVFNEAESQIHYPNNLLLNVGFNKIISNRKGQFSIGPEIRYSVLKNEQITALSATPFSVGLNFSYSTK